MQKAMARNQAPEERFISCRDHAGERFGASLGPTYPAVLLNDNGQTPQTTSTQARTSSRVGKSLNIKTPGAQSSRNYALASRSLNETSQEIKPRSRRSLAAPKAPKLDFSTIRTESPRFPNPAPRPMSKPERAFGLEHCPVYHPTPEEFALPLEYIEKIAPEARQYGICKIVPPDGWKPTLALNTETFKFQTRLQVLNSMEASARSNITFLEQLYLFHSQMGQRPPVPTVAGKPLDLWKLKRAVDSLGGYDEVSKSRKWSMVGRKIGYPAGGANQICTQIKQAYRRLITPFEDFLSAVDRRSANHAPDAPSISLKTENGVPLVSELVTSDIKYESIIGPGSLATPVGQVRSPVLTREDIGPGSSLGTEQVRTASDKLNAALGIEQAAKRVLKIKLKNPDSLKNPEPVVEIPGDSCEICLKQHNPASMVLCDGCDRGYHLQCLTPPLAKVPIDEFFCKDCLLQNGAECGFEEGRVYSLDTYRTMADGFKKYWLSEHPVPNLGSATNQLEQQIMIEDHCEREFWRLVESPEIPVEVEYGADVTCSASGGGFPCIEVNPEDPYSRDPWNLNNLPILPGSLLRYIKSDISGMTMPWIYVGMVFSTFAWHKEDHYTYSINYHHFGDTKTWYGIPGADDYKLEEAVKSVAPELFEQQPDFMFQLVTLMSPGKLQKKGVKVFVCDQRPNEFVITFPKAYHAGFNHGLNFNEAVNFALPDWLPIGLESVKRYQEIHKFPVFSHDELLVTIFQHEKSPRPSKWLLTAYQEMVTREVAARERFREKYPGIVVEVTDLAIPEEEFQCVHCHGFTFLSQAYVTPNTDLPSFVSCLEHYKPISSIPAKVRLRFSNVELQNMVLRVKSRSEKMGRITGNLMDKEAWERQIQVTVPRKRRSNPERAGKVVDKAKKQRRESEDSDDGAVDYETASDDDEDELESEDEYDPVEE